MKAIKSILWGIGLACLVAACQAGSPVPGEPLPTNPPAATSTPMALPATWTPAPTGISSATPTAAPTATLVFVTITPERTPNTPTPDPIQGALPAGVIPLRDLGWTITAQAENTIAALPYQNGDGSFGLALIDDLTSGKRVFWLSRQEPALAAIQWQTIRRMTRTLEDALLLFLGQDADGQWHLGAVTLPASGAQLIGLIPVQDPQTTFAAITRFDGQTWQFWLVEDGTLRLYQWQSGLPILAWEASDVPQDAVTVSMDASSDILPGGAPELWLRWWSWAQKDFEASGVVWQQYFVAEGVGYRLIADLPPGLQRQDVDADGVFEFLQPDVPSAPRSWSVFDWNGELFIADRTLDYPAAPVVNLPRRSELPALGVNLSFSEGEAALRWPKSGGELETLEALPQGVTCYAESVAQEVVAWSPDCAYAIVKLPDPVVGYSLGLLNVAGGVAVEIANTATEQFGYSTFDWNQASGFALHARAGSNPGLYRLDLISGLSETIFSLSTLEAGPYGVTDPYAFSDGSVGFAIQGDDERLYPPFGIYRRAVDGSLQLLADLPPLGDYGTLQWAADGSVFLFHAPYFGQSAPPYSVLLVGKTDGSLLVDVNPILGKAAGFVWR
jgi:hypothetical protein